MTTGWAMTKNYAGACTYDLPTVTCSPTRMRRTVAAWWASLPVRITASVIALSSRP